MSPIAVACQQESGLQLGLSLTTCAGGLLPAYAGSTWADCRSLPSRPLSRLGMMSSTALAPAPLNMTEKALPPACIILKSEGLIATAAAVPRQTLREQALLRCVHAWRKPATATHALEWADCCKCQGVFRKGLTWRTPGSASSKADCTSGSSVPRYSASCVREMFSSTSLSPLHTPCLVDTCRRWRLVGRQLLCGRLAGAPGRLPPEMRSCLQ